MSCIFMSCIFMSCNFMPCNLVRHFYVLQFHALLFGPSFSCPAISCPSFSAPPMKLTVLRHRTCNADNSRWWHSTASLLKCSSIVSPRMYDDLVSTRIRWLATRFKFFNRSHRCLIVCTCLESIDGLLVIARCLLSEYSVRRAVKCRRSELEIPALTSRKQSTKRFDRLQTCIQCTTTVSNPLSSYAAGDTLRTLLVTKLPLVTESGRRLLSESRAF